jgi:mono/diheme cytochrome c family protein
MDVRLIGLLILVGLFSCSESTERLKDEVVRKHLSGVKFYDQRCTVCHGPDGKLGVSDAKDLSISTLTEKQIEDIIKNGKGSMPPFEHAIESDSTLIELVEHIKMLRE